MMLTQPTAEIFVLSVETPPALWRPAAHDTFLRFAPKPQELAIWTDVEWCDLAAAAIKDVRVTARASVSNSTRPIHAE